MKKSLATLGLATSLALSGAPKANAQIDKNSDETEHQIENVFNQQQNVDSSDTISFEDAKNLQEQQELFEEILNDEKIQELVNEYGEEEVRQIINEIITNKDTEKVIEKALKDKHIEKALEEGDREGVEKGVQRIAEEVYKGGFGGILATKIVDMILGALIYIIGKKRIWHS